MIVHYNFNENSSELNPLFNIHDTEPKTISVKQCNLLFDRIPSAGFYNINWNGICRSNGNESQTLFTLYLSKGTNHLSYEPTQSLVYKLRHQSYCNTTFSLHSIETAKIITVFSGHFSFDLQENAIL